MPEDKVPPQEPAAEPKAPARKPRPRPERTEAAAAAYPTPLLNEEEELLEARRNVPPPERGRPVDCKIGFALSGGGIRSATFCLGFFQGLAAKGGLIRKIDYLSTVSGGGYFGAFLGRLFTRDYIRTPEDVESILTRDRTVDGSVGGVIRHLRENGRYLSPSGGGDLLLGGAVLFRNWVSLQVVLWTFLLMVFLGAQTVRLAFEVPFAGILTHPAWVAGPVWWSPWLIPPLMVFVICALPLGWAYLLCERVGWRLATTASGGATGGRGERWRPWIPLLLVGGLSGAFLAHARWVAESEQGVGPASVAVPAALLLIAILTPIWWGAALRSERRRFEVAINEERREVERKNGEWESRSAKKELFQDAAVRNLLSLWLKNALVVTAGLAGLAVVDSLGQTLFLVGAHPAGTVVSWIGGILAGLTALSGFARGLAVKLASFPEGGRFQVPADVQATVTGILVAVSLLVVLNAVSHAVAWTYPSTGGGKPGSTSEMVRAVPVEVMEELFHGELMAELVRGEDDGMVADRAEARLDPFHHATGGPPGKRDSWICLTPALGGFLFTLFLSLSFGRIWAFLNRSSHDSAYGSRLTRVYLGASNLERLRAEPISVTQSVPGDDIDLATHWPPPGQNAAPIHLINVTVNETIDGRSQVEQKDRKGMGLALGPCGLSVGVRHHILANFGVELDSDRARIYPEGEGRFRVFEYPGAGFRGEILSLGAWMEISGAAFSAALGTRTSPVLSILMGRTNVRRGYWWDSGVNPRGREQIARRGANRRQDEGHRSLPIPNRRRQPGRRRILGWAETPFAVQRLLKDELLARFPGTARRHWYLSDGGHFENMGGYELIRRRLPLIVVIDAEADPDYTFGGLGNLVRKARLDFGAEIEFLTPAQIDRELPPEVACHVGSLEQLRRGRWKRKDEDGETEDEACGKERRPKRPVADFEGPDRTGRCLVHAALARVKYDDGTQSRLLYVKPSLLGDEPEDVLDYHRQHPDFPQQTTADQFFDEAQWESYRRLGQHIAEKIFQPKGEGEDLSPPFWNLGRLECPPEAVTDPG